MSLSYEEVMKSNNFLPLRLDYLTEEMIQIAKEELNENETTRSSSIDQIRKLIMKEENFQCRTDDEFLLQFLRARKFNVENAFVRLQTFYQVTSKTFADIYANIEEERAKKAYGTGLGSHLPYRDRSGAAIILFKASNWNPEEIDVYSIFNCYFALVLSAVDYQATQVCGLHIVIDAKGLKFQHVRCFTPSLLKLCAKCYQDVFPARFKGIHLINCSAIFRYVWGLVAIFLGEKIRNRVHFHDKNMESLHKFIPKEILPTEYEGDNFHFDPVKQSSAELEKFLPKYLQIIHDGYKNY